MAAILAIVRSFATAVLAGLYWIASAWLCFRLTGSDPIDAVTADRPAATLTMVWSIVAGAVLVFALVERALVDRALADRAGHEAGRTTRWAPWLAKGGFAALFWFAALYLATGLFMGDRITDAGVVGPVAVMPFWLFVMVAVGGYAVCSAGWDRVIVRDRK